MGAPNPRGAHVRSSPLFQTDVDDAEENIADVLRFRLTAVRSRRKPPPPAGADPTSTHTILP